MKSASLVPALFTSIALAACGGGGDDTVIVVDAAIDAPIDAAIDAAIDAPPVCNAPNMVCGGQCTDVATSEQYLRRLQLPSCAGGHCLRPAATARARRDITIPATPDVHRSRMLQDQGGLTLGIGPRFADVHGRTSSSSARPAPTSRSTPRTPSAARRSATPPFAAFGYDVDIGSMTASAAYYATEGTLTFTKICLADSMTGQQAGVRRHAHQRGVQRRRQPDEPGARARRLPHPDDRDHPVRDSFSYGNTTCQ
jgi:hypothetical protein